MKIRKERMKDLPKFGFKYDYKRYYKKHIAVRKTDGKILFKVYSENVIGDYKNYYVPFCDTIKDLIKADMVEE